MPLEAAIPSSVPSTLYKKIVWGITGLCRVDCWLSIGCMEGSRMLLGTGGLQFRPLQGIWGTRSPKFSFQNLSPPNESGAILTHDN